MMKVNSYPFLWCTEPHRAHECQSVQKDILLKSAITFPQNISRKQVTSRYNTLVARLQGKKKIYTHSTLLSLEPPFLPHTFSFRPTVKPGVKSASQADFLHYNLSI